MSITQGNILKVVLLLSGCISAHVAYTSPNPPPKEEEQSKHAEYKRDVMNYAQKLIVPTFKFRALPRHEAIQCGLWLMALCEIIIILAQEYPSPYSKPILTALSRPGNFPPQVRITYPFLLGWIAVVFGGLTRVACYRTLGQHFTFHLSVKDDHKLITSGPYSIVRHPGYSACALVMLGELSFQFSKGSWMHESGLLDTSFGMAAMYLWAAWHFVAVALLIRRIPTEDAILKKEFRSQWVEWSKRTPYKLIPYIV
ncbi:hypothetical protein CERSUDRAFT_78167 [Gelatoporia subvermispora B]|uniref:Protein-S-isoprenylcysteine O-methyltransferase n=1 Tax=Ceriporiopsis subvermispora (strain B) TaxID=914234 RepID=M2Q3K8_CERS8|nr:hypothetical protein CERSUDRAFT_78167 [Gelatoporia subvermispora B]